jgi:hypothetical protein
MNTTVKMKKSVWVSYMSGCIEDIYKPNIEYYYNKYIICDMDSNTIYHSKTLEMFHFAQIYGDIRKSHVFHNRDVPNLTNINKI